MGPSRRIRFFTPFRLVPDFQKPRCHDSGVLVSTVGVYWLSMLQNRASRTSPRPDLDFTQHTIRFNYGS